MVTISGYAERESKEGKKFYALTLQGGMEMVLSEEVRQVLRNCQTGFNNINIR